MEAKIFSSSQNQLKEWWQYFNRLGRKAVYHSPDYLKILEGVFGSESQLFIWGDESNFIYYPYLKRRLSELPFARQVDMDLDSYWDINSSWYYGGPLLSSGEASSLFPSFLEAFSNYALKSGIVSEFVRFDANLKNHEHYPQTTVVYNRDTVYVDLTQSEAAIWSDFSSANQRALRKVLRAGYQVHEVDSREADKWIAFHEIYHGEMSRKNAPRHLNFPLSFFKRVKDDIPGKSLLLTVEKDGRICGGFIIVYDGKYAFHFLSASLPEYWGDRINNLMFYRAIMWAKKSGCRLFDFMGGRPGVFRFKSNFSTTRGKFYTYQQVHNPKIYDQIATGFRRYYGIADEAQLDYFPVYRNPGYGARR